MNRRHALKSAVALGLLSSGLVPQLTGIAREATPASDGPEDALEGFLTSNVPGLPTADDGEVQIVLQSAPLDEYVGFIIHNNSDQAVGTRDVIGVARNADGDLFAVMRIEHVSPYEIKPGQYSIGVATFDKELAPDATIELAAEFEEIGAQRRAYIDLAVTEVSVSDDEVIGIVENQSDTDVSGMPHLVGLFLDDAGEIVGLVRPYLLDSDIIAAGERTTFSERLDGGIATESWLFAATGQEAR